MMRLSVARFLLVITIILQSVLVLGAEPSTVYAQTTAAVDKDAEWRMPYYDRFNSSSLFWNPNAPMVPDPAAYDLTLSFYYPRAYVASPKVYHIPNPSGSGSKFLVLTHDRIARYAATDGALEWKSPVVPGLSEIAALRTCWQNGPIVIAAIAGSVEGAESVVYFFRYSDGALLGQVFLPADSNLISYHQVARVADA
ncbi:MAG: hypothetical protein QXO09_05995, partial [Candidatus Caldarchaeum sp.]